MHVRCPHCHSPIEFVADASFTEINCPSCGSSFSLIGGDKTETHRTTSRHLAQFELVRELGIGKFGSVWMARDTELDRTVAIKIPRKGALNTDETELFLRDARATAQLKHPNIVSVHEVGRAEETVYIVTDYIKGANLRDWLTGQRLTFRESAELIVKVAEAVHHAHQAGVVHRDLKPGNIMVDGDGQPHVIDFGLARREAGEITMTVDGHILGTPAYMSPEQAMGHGHDADRRSDVYSLGVILFELLTGELPFRGEAQMLLLQIERDEAPRPRRLNARIPRDLETITLKCLQKEPSRRYQTAQQLADDLNRWLRDEPIVARPVGRLERGWRWCKRNRVTSGLAGAALLALISGTAVSMYFAIRSDRFAREAAARAKEAIIERERAEEGFREARRAVDYYTAVSQNKLLNVPGTQPLRKELLEYALEYYQKFIGEYGDDPAVQEELARAYARVGSITNAIGSKEQGLKAIQEAVEIQEKLVEAAPNIAAGRHQLARYYFALGAVQRDTARTRDAEASLKSAIRISEQLVRDSPDVTDYRAGLADFLTGLGITQHALGLPDEAAMSYERAITIQVELAREYPTDLNHHAALATSCANLSVALQHRGRKTDEEALHRKAIDIREGLVRQAPDSSEYQNALAASYLDIGILQGGTGRPSEAESSFRRAIEIREKVLDENPNVSLFQHDLASCYGRLGDLQRSTGRPAEAEACYQKAIGIRIKLTRDNPTAAIYQEGLVFVTWNLGDAQRAMGRQADAEKSYQKAIEIREKLARDYPSVARYQQELASACWTLGDMQRELGRRVDAEASYQKAVAIREKLARDNLSVAKYHDTLGWSYTDLGILQRDMGHLVDAAASGRRAIETLESFVGEGSTVADQAILGWSYANFGFVQALNRQTSAAKAAYNRAIEIREKLLEKDGTSKDRRNDLAASYLDLAALELDTIKPDEAKRLGSKAVGIQEELVREYPAIGEYRDGLGRMCRVIGDADAMLGKWQDAAEMYADVVEVEKRSWQSLWVWGLLQLAAGDETGYRTTCAELLDKYSNTGDPSQAFWIATTCIAAENAVDDSQKVVALARQAADADPGNPIPQALLGCALYRAGQTNDAIETLKKTLPQYTLAAFAAPNRLDQIQLSRLVGETILALAYHKQGNRQAIEKQVANLRTLIGKLEKSPPKPSGGIAPWGIAFAVEIAKRELSRIQPPAPEGM